MSKLLQIDSSGKGNMSVSRPLTAYFVQKWKELNPNGKVISRDLLTSHIPPVTPEFVGAMFTPESELTPPQKQSLAVSEELIAELIAADTYVFGVPMYNFSIPGIFKLYIDQIVRAGKTFKYEGHSPQGLLKGKHLIVVTASGGDYSASPMKEMDFVEPYLRTIFGFMGVTNIEFVKVAGHDPQTVADASEHAKKHIDLLLTANIMQ